MHNPTYHDNAHLRTSKDLAVHQQSRAAQLARIAFTFLLSGNKREASRFQGMSASASAAAREALFAC